MGDNTDEIDCMEKAQLAICHLTISTNILIVIDKGPKRREMVERQVKGSLTFVFFAFLVWNLFKVACVVAFDLCLHVFACVFCMLFCSFFCIDVVACFWCGREGVAF